MDVLVISKAMVLSFVPAWQKDQHFQVLNKFDSTS